MSEKRYFWLKLKEDFFDDKQIKYLRSLPDGDKIVITYLKMQLKSLKTNGTIRYDKLLPSSAEELSMMLDEDLNIVKFTLKALEQINAIEILEDESIFMIAMQELIGSEGSSASRMRELRTKQKMLSSHCDNNVQNSASLCYGEIEVDKELEVGAKVKIIAGPFTGMYGTIEEVDKDNQKLTLNVDLFGQETSVETEISQVEMANN